MFFSAASLSGAFSGLLAAAIVNMDGIGGRPGWAWVFILVSGTSTNFGLNTRLKIICVARQEGIFTVIIGLIAFFVTPSTPKDLRFMTQREREYVVFNFPWQGIEIDV